MKEIHISMTHMPKIEGDINACIGYFDGIHKGHQQLIQAVLAKSAENKATPALITFSPDPWVVIKGLQTVPHLTTMEERKAIAEKLGVEIWIVLDFTKEMANLTVEEFHEKILFPLHLKTLVCGYDYHYAHFGKGDTHTLLAQKQFDVIVIDEVSNEHEKISSTRIEQLIQEGKMEECEILLTRPYQLRGKVVHGLKNGRRIGFPTANLCLYDSYVIPKEGVYIGQVIVDDVYYDAMINIGDNPTFDSEKEITIEAHIFNFDQDLYGKTVTFLFYSYIRGDVAFSSVEQLIFQLNKDKQQAIRYLQQRRKEASLCV